MKGCVIRDYRSPDKETVLDLFRMNTPAYFSMDEEKDLIHYLEHEIDLYYVIELNNKLIGCGGINFSENGTVGKISWDFLHPDYQGLGIGTLLLEHRINLLKETIGIQRILVRTSQHAYKFYERSGFRLMETVKDYWASGFDLYRMEYARMP